jgi:hypothetical protein
MRVKNLEQWRGTKQKRELTRRRRDAEKKRGLILRYAGWFLRASASLREKTRKMRDSSTDGKQRR